jgi:SAM-dependent methyltransferase
MSEAALRSRIGALATAAGALAAIGAALRLRRDGVVAPAEVQQRLDEVLAAIETPPLNSLDAGQVARLSDLIGAILRHALELLDNPTRPPGWNHTDPALLEAQGGGSRMVPHLIATAAEKRPELMALLNRPGAFLDVGTGVGWLAIEAARIWPALRVVAIDIWEPALARARRNIAASGLEGRIELRSQDVAALPDRAAFSLAWVPVPFFTAAALAGALARVREALAPGAWVVCGLETPPEEPLARALSVLRTVRGGGEISMPADVASYLTAAGFAAVETVPAGVLTFVLGRPPEAETDAINQA